VYALDLPSHEYLSGKRINSVDGSANMDAWNQTRLQRHIQRAEAERHLAAAAICYGGLDVLLTDTTHVLLADVMPTVHGLAKAGTVDMASARGGCDGKPPIGCGPLWNLMFLRGAGTAEQRERASSWQYAGVRQGMVDFYLRWWNGAHCINNGFGKRYSGCHPQLQDGVRHHDVADANFSEVAVISLDQCLSGLKLGLLPASFFTPVPLYGPSGVAGPQRLLGSIFGRSSKPAQRDRLRLDRYDAQDFDEIVQAMKADGLWFL
jgi:hypothetical protein